MNCMSGIIKGPTSSWIACLVLLKGHSPFSLLYPLELSFSLPSKVFGCFCYLHLLIPETDKFEPTGYGYCCYDLITRRIYICRCHILWVYLLLLIYWYRCTFTLWHDIAPNASAPLFILNPIFFRNVSRFNTISLSPSHTYSNYARAPYCASCVCRFFIVITRPTHHSMQR